MLRRIWDFLFGSKPAGSPDHKAPARLIDVPAQKLMDLCDAYWKRLSEPLQGSLADQFTPAETKRYNAYVDALDELSTRGAEILPWALRRLAHAEYDARESAAFLLGQLGTRNQLGEHLETTVDRLGWLATRPVEEDNKEMQANTAAVMALGKIGHKRGIRALRRILLSSEWDDDEIQSDAAGALGEIVGDAIPDSNDSLAAARDWLSRHPDA